MFIREGPCPLHKEVYMKSPVAHVKQTRATVAAVLFLTVLLPGLTAGCGLAADWVVYPANGHHYLVIDCGEWSDCEKQAVSKGAHLVTINDQAEQEWLIESFGERELYWTGLNDELEEGTWAWTSGETVDYTNWAPGEPNDKWECGEDYVFFSWRSPGQWNDMGPCSPEWDTVTRAIVERTGPATPSYWWILVVFLIAGVCVAAVVLVVLRKRTTSREERA
jgi:hypothetical protein